MSDLSDYLKEFGTNAVSGIKDVGQGIGQTIAHPINTASSLYNQTRQFANTPENEASWQGNLLKAAEQAPLVGPYVQQAESGGTKILNPIALGAGVRAATSLGVAPAALKGIGGAAIENVGKPVFEAMKGYPKLPTAGPAPIVPEGKLLQFPNPEYPNVYLNIPKPPAGELATMPGDYGTMLNNLMERGTNRNPILQMPNPFERSPGRPDLLSTEGRMGRYTQDITPKTGYNYEPPTPEEARMMSSILDKRSLPPEGKLIPFEQRAVQTPYTPLSERGKLLPFDAGMGEHLFGRPGMFDDLSNEKLDELKNLLNNEPEEE